MFDNISAKLKALAKVISIVGIIASCAVGIVIPSLEGGYLEVVLLGVGIALVGSVLFWVWGAIVYGLGELIENTSYIKGAFSNSSSSPRNSGADEWKCPKCQRIHKNYETSCICGYNKNRPQG